MKVTRTKLFIVSELNKNNMEDFILGCLIAIPLIARLGIVWYFQDKK